MCFKKALVNNGSVYNIITGLKKSASTEAIICPHTKVAVHFILIILHICYVGCHIWSLCPLNWDKVFYVASDKAIY